ncbi:hypothetical protein [Streptomyces venezuelae]
MVPRGFRKGEPHPFHTFRRTPMITPEPHTRTANRTATQRPSGNGAGWD